ncbi:Six-hairpin glycosidase [Guyanagaster necrorhizus]|uniref:Six-hairpin glycosidase n=1 Tax=Guyanagaster necrorhizus TaxID=856835 RepID=A0A9P7VNM2_9AGAR|nr:Six-hairpin glycosidase [Guyanagaster necrorhizus MCA 3950]KAG7443858.1 Six-hairpin glycosidase [Guyanagaster necrorhizus MCA 3950]
MRWSWLVALVAATFWRGVLCASLSTAEASNVKARLAEAAQESWELGTREQTLLETDATVYSVFSDQSLPPPSTVPDNMTDALAPVLSLAQEIVANRSASNHNISGAQPLMADGSAADPASNGVAVLIAGWTGQGDADGLNYTGAATDQLDFLLNNVSRSSDGAISHRVSQTQLWSDFVYMVPPFLAYYGVLTENETLVAEAYNQIKLYRDNLRDTNANNLWQHVVLGGSGTDSGHWSTGNGWAAAGMLRVYATIQKSQYESTFSSELQDLASWAVEIQKAMYNVVDKTYIFRNYADNESTFYDCSSTALMAYTVYRLYTVTGDTSYIRQAERSRQALYASGVTSTYSLSASSTSTSTASASASTSTSPSTSGYKHFTSDGWLTPVVNPHSYGLEGSESAEAQAFVLLMQSAYEEWVADGSQGSGALQLRVSVWGVLLALLAGVVGLL